MNTTPEEWRPIVGYEGCYEVSDQGGVRSLDRLVRHAQGALAVSGVLLKQRLDKDGYHYVFLARDGKGVSRSVHRLLLQAFVGPCPPGMLACHYDDVKSNNDLTNLRWDTPAANTRDMYRNRGILDSGGKSHCKWGHEFTDSNTYLCRSGGERVCRACRNRRAREVRERKRAKQQQ